jgi:predicted small lipoprotein YifL
MAGDEEARYRRLTLSEDIMSRLIIVTVLFSGLCSCGVPGPLYLPEKTKPAVVAPAVNDHAADNNASAQSSSSSSSSDSSK